MTTQQTVHAEHLSDLVTYFAQDAAPPVAAPVAPVADIRAWYADARAAQVGGASLRTIRAGAIRTLGKSRLFTRPEDSLTLQLPVEPEPIDGLMVADWLAQDGFSHHAYILAPDARGVLVRWAARGEGRERRYVTAPLGDGWYAFAVDQDFRLVIGGAPAERAYAVEGDHRSLLGSLPGLFFGEMRVFRRQVAEFNNHAPAYETAAHLVSQVRDIVPLLQHAKF